MTPLIETPIKYENLKKTIVLDKREFSVCKIREKEVGLLRKRLLFIHYDGEVWDVLFTNLDLTKVKHRLFYKLK